MIPLHLNGPHGDLRVLLRYLRESRSEYITCLEMHVLGWAMCAVRVHVIFLRSIKAVADIQTYARKRGCLAGVIFDIF